MIQITPVLKSIIFLWIYEEYCTCTDMLIIITVMSKQKYINDNVYQKEYFIFFQTDIYSCIWAPRIHSETYLGWNHHQIWTNLQRIWSHHLKCVWCHDQSFTTSAKSGDKAISRLGKNYQLLRFFPYNVR